MQKSRVDNVESDEDIDFHPCPGCTKNFNDVDALRRHMTICDLTPPRDSKGKVSLKIDKEIDLKPPAKKLHYVCLFGLKPSNMMKGDDLVRVMITETRVNPERKLSVIQRINPDPIYLLARLPTETPCAKRRHILSNYSHAIEEMRGDWFSIEVSDLHALVRNEGFEGFVFPEPEINLREVAEEVHDTTVMVNTIYNDLLSAVKELEGLHLRISNGLEELNDIRNKVANLNTKLQKQLPADADGVACDGC